MLKSLMIFRYFTYYLKTLFENYGYKNQKFKKYLFSLIPLLLTQVSFTKSKIDNFLLRRRLRSSKLGRYILVNNDLKIFYINLNTRNDRKQSIENELNKLYGFDYSRFDAVKNNNGALGCALSHLNVLKSWDASPGKMLMVCEDDIKFGLDDLGFKLILNEFCNDPFMDVLCLGFNHFNGVDYSGHFVLSSNIQTTSCYILKDHMRDVLVSKFSDSVEMLEHGVDSRFAAIDIVWKFAQKEYNFLVTKERYVIQKPFFSDIQNKEVNYDL